MLKELLRPLCALHRRPDLAAFDAHPRLQVVGLEGGDDLLHPLELCQGHRTHVDLRRGLGSNDVVAGAPLYYADVDRSTRLEVCVAMELQDQPRHLLDSADAPFGVEPRVRGTTGDADPEPADALAGRLERAVQARFQDQDRVGPAGLLLDQGAGVRAADLLVRVAEKGHWAIDARHLPQRPHGPKPLDEATLHVEDSRSCGYPVRDPKRHLLQRPLRPDGVVVAEQEDGRFYVLPTPAYAHVVPRALRRQYFRLASRRGASVVCQELSKGVEEAFVGRGRLHLDELLEVFEHVVTVLFEIFEGAIQPALPPLLVDHDRLTPECVPGRVTPVYE